MLTVVKSVAELQANEYVFVQPIIDHPPDYYPVLSIRPLGHGYAVVVKVPGGQLTLSVSPNKRFHVQVRAGRPASEFIAGEDIEANAPVVLGDDGLLYMSETYKKARRLLELGMNDDLRER